MSAIEEERRPRQTNREVSWLCTKGNQFSSRETAVIFNFLLRNETCPGLCNPPTPRLIRLQPDDTAFDVAGYSTAIRHNNMQFEIRETFVRRNTLSRRERKQTRHATILGSMSTTLSTDGGQGSRCESLVADHGHSHGRNAKRAPTRWRYLQVGVGTILRLERDT